MWIQLSTLCCLSVMDRQYKICTSHKDGTRLTLSPIPVNTKHLYSICTMLDQRRRRWAGVVQMLYKCFVFAGIELFYMYYKGE